MMEEWRPAVGYEGRYEVSSRGLVRRADSGRPVAQVRQSLGRGTYFRMVVSLWSDNKRRTVSVHRLVARAFLGEPEPGQEVRHLNGDATVNHVSNLRWGTRAENDADRHRHGSFARGERHGCAALTEADVYVIRASYRPRDPRNGAKALGRRYGVNPATIEAIVKRRSWAHLPGGAA